jgi:hypothetical protein
MVIVMPFPCHITRPELIDGSIFLEKVDPFLSFIFAPSMPIEIESAHTKGPNPDRTEKTSGQSMASQKIKCPVPEKPIEAVIEEKIHRGHERTIFLKLEIAIGFESRGLHKFGQHSIISLI